MHTGRWLFTVAFCTAGFAGTWLMATYVRLDAHTAVVVAAFVATVILAPLGWWGSKTVRTQESEHSDMVLPIDAAAAERPPQPASGIEQAIELYARTLPDYDRMIGPDHPDTLTLRNNLACAYHTAGRIDEAIELYARTLPDCERVLGPDHPDTLTLRNNLGCAYQAVKKDQDVGTDHG